MYWKHAVLDFINLRATFNSNDKTGKQKCLRKIIQIKENSKIIRLNKKDISPLSFHVDNELAIKKMKIISMQMTYHKLNKLHYQSSSCYN